MRKINFTRMLLIIVLMMIGNISRGAVLKSANDSTVVNFYYYSQNGTVYFTDTTISTIAIASRTWQFGDSTTSTLSNPTHTYAANIYKANVCLSVKTINGTSFTLCKEITVRTPKDTCNADFNYIVLDSTSARPLVRFTDQSSFIGKIVSRSWSLSDSTQSTDSTFVHRFDSTLNSAIAYLTIRTNLGCQSTASKIIYFPNKCQADFSYTAQNGTVTFTETPIIEGIVKTRAWVFGDYTYSSQKDPIHTYDSTVNNAYVCYTIITTTNHSCSICKNIIVRPVDSCTANYSYVRIDSAGTSPTYRFTDTSFGTSTIVSRKWVFEDSTLRTDSLFTHQFASNLSIATVCLTTKTSSGCQSSICKTITLKDTLPAACKASFFESYQPDSSSTTGAMYIFTNTSSSNATSYEWWFGDGTSSTVKNPIHIYHLKPGSMAYVRLQIKTNINCTDTFVRIITIPRPSNDSCTANFTYVRIDNSGVYPTLRFTDTSFGTSQIAWRRWSLSDSTHLSDSTFFVHRFASNLTEATVNLTIGTTSGCQSSVYKTIVLKDTIPVTCKASFVASYQPDSSGTTGARYVFANTSSGNATSFVWSFGDGTNSTLKNPTHIYSFNKDTILPVGLFIRSANGCADSTFQQLNIHGTATSFTISGTVEGKDELLPQGIIALYKKATNGFFMLADVKIISNGLFNFEKLSKGKYMIYAIPHIYYASKYLPTYYVNKLHWGDAQIIDLKSNAYGLTLQLVPVKSITPGPCRTTGKVVFSGAVEQKSLKSDITVSYQVNLYTESGTILASITPNELGNFTFDNLPYGKYLVKIEYPNLTSNNIVVNLSPESPEAINLSFLINTNTLSVNSLSKESKMTVYNVSTGQIAVRLNTGGKYRMSLINISGQVLMDEQLNFEMNTDKIISVGTIPKGIYILKLQSNTNTIIEKILK